MFAHHGVMVSCIDGYMRNVQMTMVADALGDYSEPEHRMALQYVADAGRLMTHGDGIVDAIDQASDRHRYPNRTGADSAKINYEVDHENVGLDRF